MVKEIRRGLSALTALMLCASVSVFSIPRAYAQNSSGSTVIQQGTDGTVKNEIPLEISNPIREELLPDPELRCFTNPDGSKTYWIYGTGGSNINATYSEDNMKTWTSVNNVIDMSTFPWATFNIWAPGVIEHGGKYYIVFAANNVPDSGRVGGIGIGVSDSPAGPFRAASGSNEGLLADASLYGVIPSDSDEVFKEKLANKPTIIDPCLFEDDDGQIYLYYGGGGHLAVCMVNDTLTGLKSFSDGSKYKEVTDGLSGYMEGPFMIKRGGVYYMMYSTGVWSNGSYGTCYGITDSPVGTYRDSRHIIQSSEGNYPYMGPGHNSALYMPENNLWLICYHRYNYFSDNRKSCIDVMTFNADGSIHSITPTDGWSSSDMKTGINKNNLAVTATAIDSSTAGGNYGYYGAGSVSALNDSDDVTYWQFSDGRVQDNSSTLTDCWAGYDFGTDKKFNKVVIQWESGTMCTENGYAVEYSADGTSWNSIENASVIYGYKTTVTFDDVTARYVRVSMTEATNTKYSPKIYELKVFCATAENPGEDFVSENYAAGCAVTASGSQGTSFEPANAVDGNSSTEWRSQQGTGEYVITVDLGSIREISRVSINWGVSYATKFYVETSVDQVTWTAITQHGSTEIKEKQSALQNLDFPAVSAKYVRMRAVTKANAEGCGIYELEVYLIREAGSANNSFTFEDGIFSGAEENTTVKTLLETEGVTAVRNKSGALVTDGEKTVGTGFTVTKDGIDYTAVIKGDVNGDGKVGTADFLMIRDAYLQKSTLSQVEILAANVRGNGEIGTADFLMVRDHYLGKIIFTPENPQRYNLLTHIRDGI